MNVDQLIVLLGHRHKVHTYGARRKACPSSSEVHADVVRRRPCPFSSEVVTCIVRRGEKVQSLLLRSPWRRGRRPPQQCEEQGRRAIPLPPKYPRLSLTKPPDLGGGEPVSPPPVGVTKNLQLWVMPNNIQQCASSTAQKGLTGNEHLKH